MLNREDCFVKPLQNESFEQYKSRVYTLKKENHITTSWRDIADMFIEYYGINRHHTTWLRDYQQFCK